MTDYVAVCVLGERLVTNFRLQWSKSTQEEARVRVSLSRCEHLSSRGSVEIVADRSVVDKKNITTVQRGLK